MPRFLDCPTYAIGQLYTCQPPEIQPGWSGWVGCDMGCRVCDDHPPEFVRKAVRVHGKRWLMPDESRQARDAHGRIHDMQAGRPHRVPLTMDYLRSPCWKNDATECHGGVDVCDCHPGESTVAVLGPGGWRCEMGEATGELLLGTFPDCIAYTGFEISANASAQGWMQCRLVHQHFNINTSLRSGRLFQGIYHRIGDSSHGATAAGGGPGATGLECSATMMAECVGKVVQSQCEQGYYHVDPDNPPIHYHDHPCRDVFNFCLVSGNTAHIIDNELFPLRDQGLIAAKNAVLAVLSDPGVVFPDGRDLRQLDYAGATLGNAWLDYWSRGVGIPDGMPCDDPAMIVAATFPKSYLKNSRCPVRAELYIVRAAIEMSLVPYKVDWSPSPTSTDFERQVHPYARVRIWAECGVRATLPDGECVLIRPWIPEGEPGHSVTLSIVNPGAGECASLPAVFPDVDQIVYVDAEDRIVNPPLHVEWRGYLGAFSDPPNEDRWVDADACWEGSSMTAKCLRLAAALSGMRIPGWPTHGDSKVDDPNQVYGGHLELDFRNDTYLTCCNEGAP